MTFIKLVLLIFIFSALRLNTGEIIKNDLGEFFILRSDGSFEKLPPPKPGHTYKIVKKKYNSQKPKKSFFSRVEKKGRVKSPLGRIK